MTMITVGTILKKNDNKTLALMIMMTIMMTVGAKNVKNPTLRCFLENHSKLNQSWLITYIATTTTQLIVFVFLYVNMQIQNS